MVKYICKDCPDPCEITVADGSDVPSCCPFRLTWKAVNWHEASENLQDKPLPKLTAEVFDRPDCPEWAKYAAVDECGYVRLFSNSPWLGKSCWNWSKGEVRQLIGVKFDASNWQKSRIKRPEEKYTLPEWCKVGEWMCYPNDEVSVVYLKISDIADGCVFAKEKNDLIAFSFDTFSKNAKPARLRPFNADEMKALMGKVIEKGPSMHIVTGFENVFDNECMVHVNGCLYGANDLLRQFTINNKPAGVLEHLENGEWVE